MLSETLAEKLYHSKILDPYDGEVKIIKAHLTDHLLHVAEDTVRTSHELKHSWMLSFNGKEYEFYYHHCKNGPDQIIDTSKENVLAKFLLKFCKRHWRK